MCDCAGQRDIAISIDCLVAAVDEVLQSLPPRPYLTGQWPRSTLLEDAIARSMRPSGTAERQSCGCSTEIHETSWLADDFPSHVNEAIETAAVRLDVPTRHRFERLLGTSLKHVRMSIGAAAQRSTEALGISAYTVGDRIVFGKNRFDPDSILGDRLLAHELVHVIQQSMGDSDDRPDGSYLRRLEWQAHQLSDYNVPGRFEAPFLGGGLTGPILPAPRMLQAVTIGPKGRACMGKGCPVAVPDLLGTGAPTGCVIADCDVPHGPSPKTIISFFCLYACESGRGAVMFRTTAGFMCGPISTII